MCPFGLISGDMIAQFLVDLFAATWPQESLDTYAGHLRKGIRTYDGFRIPCAGIRIRGILTLGGIPDSKTFRVWIADSLLHDFVHSS